MARKKTHSGNPRKTASESKGNDSRQHSESERAFGPVFDKSGSVGGVSLPQLRFLLTLRPFLPRFLQKITSNHSPNKAKF